MDKARIEIREGDVLQLPFPAEVFDLVGNLQRSGHQGGETGVKIPGKSGNHR
jgi:hypothetical protein